MLPGRCQQSCPQGYPKEPASLILWARDTVSESVAQSYEIRGDFMTLPTRRSLITGAVAVAVGQALAAPVMASVPPIIKLPGDVQTGEAATVMAVRTVTPAVALTFDDGPHPQLTPKLLDMLKSRGMRATFYVIGDRVLRHPALVQRMLAEGHEVGNHSWTHPVLANLGDRSVIREMDDTTRAIYSVTGKVPVTMRPPYGALTFRQRHMLYHQRRLPTILWSVDPQDWRRPGAQVVARRMLAGVKPGAILLAHDIHSPTIQAMPTV